MKDHPSSVLRAKREKMISTLFEEDISVFFNYYLKILDEYFHECYEYIKEIGSYDTQPYAIIGLGSYGRKEQCLHSDIDILFLFDENVPDKAEKTIRTIIYPLWDTGFSVGHSTRSIEECITMSIEDIEILTSLIDGRFICGWSPLYSKFKDKFKEHIFADGREQIIKKIIEINKKRHKRFGDSTYLLEPNLKDGRGGLRDYHTMLWISRICSGIEEPRDLERYGYLSSNEFDELMRALSFIWRIRNHLHRLMGKRSDRLYFEFQEKIAGILNYEKKDGQQPVERFLGDLHRQMNFIKHRYEAFIEEFEKGISQQYEFIDMSNVNGISVIEGMIGFVSPEAVLNSPELLIKIFEESARLNIPLNAESGRLIKDMQHDLINDKFRRLDIIVHSFENILVMQCPEFDVLDEMLETGFLPSFIPEFSGIVNRIQYDDYHLHPVDKHMLKTVRTIKNFSPSDDPSIDLCARIYKGLSDPKPLLWAALLHDIGKSELGGKHAEKGAAIVRTILSRSGYSPEYIDTVSFLVQEHLLLAQTASRRDIMDEETVIFCARRIIDIDRLKMLYILTVADSISTGPKAWNSWISYLLRTLYYNTLSILEKGELATSEAVEIVEKKKMGIIDTLKLSDSEAEALLKFMPPRYFLYTQVPDILRHMELYKRLETKRFVWNIDKDTDIDTRIITICAKDRPGLFSKIAGTFTLNNIDILNAKVYTWKNRTALDIFKVKPPADRIFEDEKWNQVGGCLESALSGKLDLSTILCKTPAVYKPGLSKRPHRILVDNDTSRFFTIVEVFTYDFLGLLFRITDALFRCGLDIWVAKIATNVDQVVDVFYVRNIEGEKIDSPEEISSIKSAIEAVLPLYNQDN